MAPKTPDAPAPVLELAQRNDEPADLQGKRVERRWRVVPFGRIKTSFDDNLFISSTSPESDLVFTISPGIAAGWGDYAKEVRQLGEFEHYFDVPSVDFEDTPEAFAFVKYLASASIFSQHSDQDALDHDALLSGRWELAKLRLDGNLFFRTLSGADVEVGDRVKRTLYGGSLTSTYGFSEKSALEITLSNNSTDTQGGVDWSEWVLEDYLNYQAMPKTRLAIGTRFGLVDVTSGDTQTYEGLVAKILYSTSSKVVFSLDGGLERRQYGSGSSDELLPVFNLAASYQPFDGTAISGNAYRRTTASVLAANEDITATGVAARLRQRFLQRVFFTLESGYDRSEYGVNGSGGTNRSDNRLYVKPSISFDVTKYLSAESSYQYQHNDSSINTFTFTENIVTVQLDLQF